MATFLTALAALTSAAIALIGHLRSDERLRSGIKTDTEILGALQPGTARDQLIAHIEERVTRLVDSEARRRDWGAVAYAILGVPLLTVVAAELLQGGAWWSVPLGVLAGLFALGGVFIGWEGSAKTHRDSRGVRVRRPRPERRQISVN